MLRYFIILVVTASSYANSQSNCGRCQKSGVACVSETQFKICVGENREEIIDHTVYTCPHGSVCSGLDIVCAPPEAGSDCKPSACGVCVGLNAFTCTSRSTFALCVGGRISDVNGTCPDSLFCDTSSPGGVCKTRCEIKGNLECDHDINGMQDQIIAMIQNQTFKPASLPSASVEHTNPQPLDIQAAVTDSKSDNVQALTPAMETQPIILEKPTRGPLIQISTRPSILVAAQVCAGKRTVGRFPYPNDPECKSYVQCRYLGIILVGVPNNCPASTYFNNATQLCENVKPANCT